MLSLQDNNTTWPYYITPYFTLQTQIGQYVVAGQIQAICPIVQYNQRLQWEEYTRLSSSNMIYSEQYQSNPISSSSTSSSSLQIGLYTQNHVSLHHDHIRHLEDRTSIGTSIGTSKSKIRRKAQLTSVFTPTTVSVPLQSTPVSKPIPTAATTPIATTSTPTRKPTIGPTLVPTTTITSSGSTTTTTTVADTTNTTLLTNVSTVQAATKFTNIYSTITKLTENDIGLLRQIDPNPYYAPIWQISPFAENHVNFDLLSISFYNRSFMSLVQHPQQGTILSPAIYPSFDPTDASTTATTPYSMFFTPIFQNFKNTYNKPNDNNNNATSGIVALLASLVPIELFFTNIYEIESIPTIVHLVVTDQSNRSYTYQINGPTVRDAIILLDQLPLIGDFFTKLFFCFNFAIFRNQLTLSGYVTRQRRLT
jgi:hypothetical protein